MVVIFLFLFAFLNGFDFLSVIFKGSPNFSLTNFAPAYIKSFNSVISFVGISVNKSVLDLTVLQSWFLRKGNVIFLSDMILLMVFFSFFLLGQCLRLCVCGAWVIVMQCLVRSF